MISGCAYYVYVDYRKDVDVPFYVGEGNHRRVLDFKSRNVVWHRIAKKHGVRREIVLMTSIYDIVLSEEIELIRSLKTRDYNGGANLTDGGEGSVGWIPSETTRVKMRLRKLGIKLSEQHRKSMSVSHKRRYESQVERDKTGTQQKRVWADSMYREHMSNVHAGQNNSRAILTENDVRAIRQEWNQISSSKRGAIKDFCVRWGNLKQVTSEAIYCILTRKTWKHVE
jgi:hypothetical protein